MPWRGGGAVTRATGRVFFTLSRQKYACSGAVVGRDVVVTAAHCVSDGAGRWADNWTFIPGYRAGKAPYGTFRARTIFVSSLWAGGGDPAADVAFVRVVPANPRAAKRIPPSLPISFARAPRGSSGIGHRAPATKRPPASKRTFVFGYPAAPPYSGKTLDYCAGAVRPDPYGDPDKGLACKMTEGDSGGPWLSKFNKKTGSGVIVGLTSFKYSGKDQVLYSPFLGTVAHKLYTTATAKAPAKK